MAKWAWVACSALMTLGCASTPEQDARREQAQRDIEAILSQPSDAGEYATSKRCLARNEHRDFRALDSHHILFEGSRDRLWINKLTIPCHDLRHATALRVKSTSSLGRICKLDTFQAGDWFDWPWYQRSPWRWTSPWSSGINCSLGEFQEVTPAQVVALEKAIRSRYR